MEKWNRTRENAYNCRMSMSVIPPAAGLACLRSFCADFISLRLVGRLVGRQNAILMAILKARRVVKRLCSEDMMNKDGVARWVKLFGKIYIAPGNLVVVVVVVVARNQHSEY
jgi:hypothetical protein